MSTTFLDRLRELLESTDQISREDAQAAIKMIQEHRRRKHLRIEGPCLNCRKPIQYDGSSKIHKQRGDAWLDSLFEKWSAPPSVDLSGRDLRLNGYKRDSVDSYICPQCIEQVEELIELERQRIAEARHRSAQQAYKDDWEIIKGEKKATPAKRFWTMTRYITPKDQETLATMPYKDFLNSHYWAAVRGYVLYKRGFACELCNNSERLQVHHRTYEHRGQEYQHLGDLIVLCRECHAKFHDKLPD